jgi:hypothetical protein
MIDKANEHEAIINQIRELEPEELSPIAAWQLLSELQKQILGES